MPVNMLDTMSSTLLDVSFIRLQVSAIFVSVSVKPGNAQFKVSFARLSLNHFMLDWRRPRDRTRVNSGVCSRR